MDIQALTQRVSELEDELKSLKQASSLPYEFEQALKSRGFLTTDTLMISGLAQIGPQGHVHIPMPGVSSKAIVLTTSANAAGNVPQGIIIDTGTLIPGINDLYIEGDFDQVVNYIIFITANRHPELLLP